MIEFIAYRNEQCNGWDYSSLGMPIGLPLVSPSGAWVVIANPQYLIDGRSGVWVRDCRIDEHFAVPCAKIIGTITLEFDGRLTWEGEYVPFYYTQL